MSLNKKWIGIPFRWGGQDFDGCDCTGLVRLYLKEEFGKHLPPDFNLHFALTWLRRGQQLMVDYLNQHAMALQPGIKPSHGDIVVIKSGIMNSAHVGVMLDRERFLHVTYGQTSFIGRIDTYGMHRVIGYWRFK